jgi:hypothetical protein
VSETLLRSDSWSRSCRGDESWEAEFFALRIASQRGHSIARLPCSNQWQELRIAPQAFAIKMVKPSDIQPLR